MADEYTINKGRVTVKDLTDFDKEVINEERKNKFIELMKEFENDEDIGPTYTTRRFVRFFKACSFDVPTTTTMLRTDIEWRKENNIDNAVEDFLAEEHAAKILEYWPSGMHGVDHRGLPVFYERIGLVHPQSLFAALEPRATEILLKFHRYNMENNERLFLKAAAESNIPNVEVNKGAIVVEDLTGLGWTQFYLPGITLLKGIYQTNQEHYPANLKAVYIVNAPSIFSMFWSALTPFLGEGVVSRVNILSQDNYVEVLKKDIKEDTIPEFLGGVSKDYKIGPGGIFGGGAITGYETTYIAAGNYFDYPVEIDKDSVTIGWEFKSIDYNIGFTVLFGDKEIVPMKQYEAHLSTVQDKFEIPAKGKYILRWDNSYSWTRGKNLLYKVNVLDMSEQKSQEKNVSEKFDLSSENNNNSKEEK